METAAIGSVLVVEDDVALARVVAALLEQAGIAARTVARIDEALAAIERSAVDVVVTDLRLPDGDGMALLDRLTADGSDVPVVIMTAHGTVPLAVEAMKRGAADFLLKPFDREEFLFVVRKALAAASHDAPPKLQVASVVADASSTAMRECRARIARAAQALATVLLLGESGTGKSVAARSIHAASPRKSAPFVTLQCAALPDNLLEAETFGYEKGAFTGAVARKPGRVELAEGGTLFLDEVGDVSLPMQAKLLRLVQEREYERLGGVATLHADVRFVAATHRDLEAMVALGTFREDLFYRLNVIPIRIPALRERAEDIVELAIDLARDLAKRNGRAGKKLSRSALDAILAHGWPGNVRQLQNVIERLVVMTERDVIDEADVARELQSDGIAKRASADLAGARRSAERDALVDALAKANDNRTLAARLLGVSRRTLYNKLEEHGIR